VVIEDFPRTRSAPGGEAFSRRVGELVDGIARASEDDLSLLYDLTATRVFGLALRILRNEADAQEVTLDVYTRVWRRASSYDAARGSAWTLMVLITRNLAIDRLRSRRSHSAAEGSEELLKDLEWMGDSPEGQLEAAEARERIRRVFQGLPEEQREVLKLAFFEGLTHSEAAARLGEPLGTVKTRIRGGLARLRRAFLGEEGRSAATQ
jgi:RNA polymerase sigma-70 factor (ECF subfamily)